MRNHSLDQLLPTRNYPVDNTHLQLQENEPVVNGEHAMIETFVLKEIHDEIERLPGLCKTVFKLIFFHDMNNSEIAEKLHIPMRTVLDYKKEALSSLRFTVLKKCLTAKSKPPYF